MHNRQLFTLLSLKFLYILTITLQIIAFFYSNLNMAKNYICGILSVIEFSVVFSINLSIMFDSMQLFLKQGKNNYLYDLYFITFTICK